MLDPHLKPIEAYNLLRDQGPDVFRREFGDEFVIGMTTGGRYIGLLQLEKERDGDDTEIKATIQAAGGLLIGRRAVASKTQ